MLEMGNWGVGGGEGGGVREDIGHVMGACETYADH